MSYLFTNSKWQGNDKQRLAVLTYNRNSMSNNGCRWNIPISASTSCSLYKRLKTIYFIYSIQLWTRWLYCVECPQHSTWLEALGYMCDCLSGHVQRSHVVKVIWYKAYRRCRRMVQCHSTGDGNMSSQEGTLMPPGEYDWTCASFSPLKSTTEMANWSVQPCLHRWPQSVPILVCLFPPQNCSFPCWHLDLMVHWFTRVRNANGNLIVSAVFPGLTSVTDWQSDR